MAQSTNGLTLRQLRRIANERNIPDWMKLTKFQLEVALGYR